MIQIPSISISPDLPFRWFVEYVIDNSPKFQTASAIAKAAAFLNADLDTPGVREVPEAGLKLVREALLSEDPPFQLPELAWTPEGGGESQKLTPRVYSVYVNALLLDVEAEAVEAPSSSASEELKA